MANLNYEQFKTEITENIKDYLPDDYKNAEVKISTMTKIGKTYDGLIVRPKNKTVSATADLNMFFDSYESGKPINEIMESIADVIQINTPIHTKDMSWLLDYNKAKERLFIRVSNANNNKKLIETVPNKKVEDLIITCHVVVEQGPTNIASTIVNSTILEHYGISEEQLFKDAMENSPKVMPVRIDSMQNFLSELLDNDKETTSSDMTMLIVTNKTNVNGAAAVFYTGVMDKISKKIGGNFIMLPSSVNEVIIIPDKGNYNTLANMVKDINETAVEPYERLSDSVYRYDSERKSLSVVA